MRQRRHLAVIGCLLLWASLALAQVTVGENTKLNLSGNVSFGYNGGFSNTSISNHGITIGGNGTLTGSYYNPNFLSFRVQPFYNRSQSNSSYQSISDSSGVTGTVNIFGGSHFPGSISYSKMFTGSGQFGIPGVEGLTTHGSGQSFTIAWSEVLPKLPPIIATYSVQSSDSEIYGTSGADQSSSRNLALQTSYRLAGFNLMGNYNHQSNEAAFPALQAGGSEQKSNTESDGVAAQASHAIPLHGVWSFGWAHSTFNGDSAGGTTTASNSGSINSLTSGLSVNPVNKLLLSFNTNYNDNVFGLFQQQLQQQGGGVPSNAIARGIDSESWLVNASASYVLLSRVSLIGRWSRNQQFLEDGTRTLTQYGGNANFNFAHRLLGALTFSLGVVDSATQKGNTNASLVGNVNFLRRLRGWDVSASFDYSQQVQTLDAISLTSGYGYGGQARRRFGDRLIVSGAFRGRHSGMSAQSGSGNRSESYTGSLGYGRFGANATFSQSSGISVLTPQGLVAIPDGIPISAVKLPTLYSGTSFGVGASAVFRGFNMSFSYSNAHSATSGAATSAFETRMLHGRIERRLRKMYLQGGFTRFEQGFGFGRIPTSVNSYYIGISRWFNVF